MPARKSDVPMLSDTAARALFLPSPCLFSSAHTM
jgi:hypothetical protein